MFLVLFILLTLTCKLNYIGGVDRNELLQSFERKVPRQDQLHTRSHTLPTWQCFLFRAIRKLGVFQKFRARPSSSLNNDIDNDDDDDYDNDSSLLIWLRYFLRRMILHCLFDSVLFCTLGCFS